MHVRLLDVKKGNVLGEKVLSEQFNLRDRRTLLSVL